MKSLGKRIIIASLYFSNDFFITSLLYLTSPIHDTKRTQLVITIIYIAIEKSEY